MFTKESEYILNIRQNKFFDDILININSFIIIEYNDQNQWKF